VFGCNPILLSHFFSSCFSLVSRPGHLLSTCSIPFYLILLTPQCLLIRRISIPLTASLKVKIPAKVLAKPAVLPAKQPKPKPPLKPPKQTKWSDANSAELIKVLTEQQAAGNQSDNSWKGCMHMDSCRACTSRLGTHIGWCKKDAKKCNGHWDKVHTSENGGVHWSGEQQTGNVACRLSAAVATAAMNSVMLFLCFFLLFKRPVMPLLFGNR
jgi:hypothetical protein